MLAYPTVRRERTPKPRFRLLIVGLLLLSLVSSRYLVMTSTPTASANQTAGETDQLATQQRLEELKGYLTVKEMAPSPRIWAKNYLLMDGETGDVLVSQDPDQSIAVASTTKMTTALVAAKLLDLNSVVTISSWPPNINGSKINLRAGERIKVVDLIKGLLISSGNDAAFALAEAYTNERGNYQPFVAEMNKFLAEQGIVNTKFGDPAGLDDDTGRSTSRDLAHAARLLLKNPILAEIVNTPSTTIYSVDGAISHELKNTNRLIQSDTSYYLPNALGVKTGFTPVAGHCLVSAYKLNGRLLIGAVMNTTEFTITASASEMNKLFVWAEQNVIEKSY